MADDGTRIGDQAENYAAGHEIGTQISEAMYRLEQYMSKLDTPDSAKTFSFEEAVRLADELTAVLREGAKRRDARG